MSDGKIIELWEQANEKAKEMGFQCERRGHRLFIVNPKTRGAVELMTAEAVLAYLSAWQYASRAAAGEKIEDGFGSVWNPRCPTCGELSMQVVRPGKVQCGNCG